MGVNESQIYIQPSDIEPSLLASKCRVLLLGTGFCGKTTLFFQLQNSHDYNTEKFIEIYQNRIRYYFIQLTSYIFEIYKTKYSTYPNGHDKVLKFLKDHNNYVSLMTKKEELYQVLAVIGKLWKDEGMLESFKLYHNDGEAEQ